MGQFLDYHNHGWRLCAIDVGKKGPEYHGWNENPIPEDAVDGLDGAGLLHVASGTCAIDLDNMGAAREWLAQRGIDIDALLAADDAVQISSGRPNRAKLLYKMKRPLRTLKPKGSGLELRSATREGLSVQDVLPPTIHKDTKQPYVWAGGILSDWRDLPPVPASILALWRSLVAEEPEGSEPSPPPMVTRPNVDLTLLKRAAFKHDPNCEHDEWLKVGMQLHDGTGGAQEGFDIWKDWSSKATRDQQGMKGVTVFQPALMKARWLSFGGAGKHVASGAALAAELPADAEEFPIEAISGPTTEDLIKETAAATKKSAIALLEKRLVFVHSVERYFDLERHKVIGSDNAIEHMFTSFMPRGKNGRVNPVKMLKESPNKQFADSLGFHPGAGVLFNDRMGDTFANTYKDRLPQALEPTKGELERIVWLFDRIDNKPYRDWLLQFFGHVVQYPGVKIKSAPLIWSETQGNGKTTLLKMLPLLLVGVRYSREVTCALLNSDFNDYLLNAWHVNLTEFRAGSRGDRAAIAQKLRAWITDEEIALHPKGLSAYSMPNHFFVTATSNEDDAAAIDGNDRRWAVHEMRAPQFTQAEQEWVYTDFLLTPRAAGVLRHYFLNMPLKGFSPSAKALETESRKEMVQASMSPDIETLQVAWEQRSEPLTRDVVLTSEVADYIRRNTRAAPSAVRIGRMLSKPPFGGRQAQFKTGESAYRMVLLRTGKNIISHVSVDSAD